MAAEEEPKKHEQPLLPSSPVTNADITDIKQGDSNIDENIDDNSIDVAQNQECSKKGGQNEEVNKSRTSDEKTLTSEEIQESLIKEDTKNAQEKME